MYVHTYVKTAITGFMQSLQYSKLTSILRQSSKRRVLSLVSSESKCKCRKLSPMSRRCFANRMLRRAWIKQMQKSCFSAYINCTKKTTHTLYRIMHIMQVGDNKIKLNIYAMTTQARYNTKQIGSVNRLEMEICYCSKLF